MHEPFFTAILSQEIARKTRKHQFGDQDPDELYKNEMWDSLDSFPSFRTVVSRLVAFVTRRKPATSQLQGDQVKSSAQSTQCVPQG